MCPGQTEDALPFGMRRDFDKWPDFIGERTANAVIETADRCSSPPTTVRLPRTCVCNCTLSAQAKTTRGTVPDDPVSLLKPEPVQQGVAAGLFPATTRPPVRELDTIGTTLARKDRGEVRVIPCQEDSKPGGLPSFSIRKPDTVRRGVLHR